MKKKLKIKLMIYLVLAAASMSTGMLLTLNQTPAGMGFYFTKTTVLCAVCLLCGYFAAGCFISALLITDKLHPKPKYTDVTLEDLNKRIKL